MCFLSSVYLQSFQTSLIGALQKHRQRYRMQGLAPLPFETFQTSLQSGPEINEVSLIDYPCRCLGELSDYPFKILQLIKHLKISI